MCLEKGRKFWKSQGKIREFHVEKNVGTLCESLHTVSYNPFVSGPCPDIGYS